MTTKEKLMALADKYGVHVWGAPQIRGREVYVRFHQLPVLPFFFDVSQQFSVPIEKIKVDSEIESTGCETCGDFMDIHMEFELPS